MSTPIYFSLGSHLPTFGQKIPGKSYLVRPGAYALVFSQCPSIALIQTRQGYFLPGGGANSGETPSETVQREVLEECGYNIAVGKQLGSTVDYIFSPSEAKYFEIQSVFFEGSLGRQIREADEEDHKLVWLTVSEAEKLLKRPSQAWVVEMACKRLGIKKNDNRER